MSYVKILVLGSRAPYPGSDDLPSVAIVPSHEGIILLDSGEGVQHRLSRAGLSVVKVKLILITHMHGDHILGLIPLLQSRSLSNARSDVVIIGPKGIKDYLEASFNYLLFKPLFNVVVHELSNEERLDVGGIKGVEIYALPLKHSVLTFGYVINICRKVKISYITDTQPLDKVPEHILGSDVLIHDATFSYKDRALAMEHSHSTALDAALTALKSNTKILLLYHISPRYKDDEILLIEARRYFRHSYVARKFMKLVIPLRSRP